MSHFRIWHERKGGHVHLAVFAGRARALTHGKCGDLCMTVEEFDEFRGLFWGSYCEFIDRAQERADNGQFGVGA